jgi:hypothetical protein
MWARSNERRTAVIPSLRGMPGPGFNVAAPETAEIVSQFGRQVLVEFYAHAPIRGSVPLRGPERQHRQSRRGCERS